MADAYTRIADSFVPAVWARYQFEESVQKMDIFQAGILYSDTELTSRLANGGYVVDMPMWHDLANIPSEPVNDDPTDNIEVKKLTSRKERAARNIRAQAWGIADLTAVLAGDDPMRILTQRQSAYWQRAHKLTLIAMLKGIIADNVANDSGDLVRDTNATIADTDLIDAAYLMGDRADKFTTIWMHSKQMAVLRKGELIDYLPASQSDKPMLLPYYQGLRVVVDDDIPVATNEYTAFMFADRAIHWAELPVELEGGPFEVDRKPRAGHGGGVTEVVSRRHFVPHIKGFTYIGTPADEFATDTELATATSWDRATADKKNVPFIALKTTEA
jgi:hypothetical protein